MTCEVLKMEKEKLIAETRYYQAKEKESIANKSAAEASEKSATAKRMYYELLIRNSSTE